MRIVWLNWLQMNLVLAELRKYFFQTGTVYATTHFVFMKHSQRLKAKWTNKKRPDHITGEIYLAACEDLCAMVEDRNIQIEEISFSDRGAFNESKELVSTYKFDPSYAFQLVNLKRGMFSALKAGEVVLISEDGPLLRAAICEGLNALDINSLKP